MITFLASLVLLGAVDAPAQVVQQTLLQKLNMPTIYILVVCSMIIVWLVVDGYAKTAVPALLPGAVLMALRDRFRTGDYGGALDYCRAQAGFLTTVTAAGLRHVGAGREAVEEALVGAVAGENARFQNKIAYLSVIGVIAPMIGLVGTVLGMIEAFSAMGQAGAADPSKLSGAIGKVLYATAGGLVVAIPAFVFYYLLRNRTGHAIHRGHEAVAELFRGFPYADLAGRAVPGDEVAAARPNWVKEPASDMDGAAPAENP